jgi:hypothetical protein
LSIGSLLLVLVVCMIDDEPPEPPLQPSPRHPIATAARAAAAAAAAALVAHYFFQRDMASQRTCCMADVRSYKLRSLVWLHSDTVATTHERTNASS